jgi:hypothetical protein
MGMAVFQKNFTFRPGKEQALAWGSHWLIPAL